MKTISRRDFLRGSAVSAFALALGMIPGVAYAEEGTEGEIIASGEKYTATLTADGWVKVVNEGGATLGYSVDSGVTLIEVDGYAFKDLNGNGELDPYEDWRLSDEERAANAVSLMSIEDMAGLRISPLTMSADPNSDTSLTIGDEEGTLEGFISEHGIRYSDAMAYTMMNGTGSVKDLVEYSNKIQALSEASGLGLPFVLSADPSSALTGYASEMMQAATFDTDAVNKLWQETSKGYRAIGVTMMLGPQVDLETDPRALTAVVFSEDPQLAVDMTNAAINGMQSTYDEDGNDLGWGTDSVVCQMKHFAANNAVEGGRSYHYEYGKYTVYPGDAFETQLIPYVDGGFYLDGATQQTGGIMMTYSIPYSEDGSLGDNAAGALNSYLVNLARNYGFDGLIATDAIGVSQYDYDGSYADATAVDQLVTMFTNGVDQILSSEFSFQNVLDAYDAMVEQVGEEETRTNFENAAYNAIIGMFRTGIVDNAYLNVSDSVNYIQQSETVNAEISEIMQSSIVMLKNSNNAINQSTGDKETVYIPMIYEETSSMQAGDDGEWVTVVSGEWVLPCSLETASEYFNVITDTTDEEGNIVRASDEEIAECTKAVIMITNPDTGSGYDDSTGEYLPISLQYSEYVADSEYVRQTSIAGDKTVIASETPYGVVETSEQENRSYYGNSTVATNLDHMELVQEVSARMPEGVSVIVCINSAGAMIFSEIEEYADAILLMFGRSMMGGSDMGVFTDPSVDNFLALVAGEVEPSALLPIQMPANMETVEAQCEDVPRDMECYVDADGNTYDFTFGMNWSGVIADERVTSYNVEALTTPTAQVIE